MKGCHFHPALPFSHMPALAPVITGPPKICPEFNERKERITRGGCTGRKACRRPRGRDKWELEVSKTPRCDDSKVSYPTKQQVRTNYSMWPRGPAAGPRAELVNLEKRSHKSTDVQPATTKESTQFTLKTNKKSITISVFLLSSLGARPGSFDLFLI